MQLPKWLRRQTPTEKPKQANPELVRHFADTYLAKINNSSAAVRAEIYQKILQGDSTILVQLNQEMLSARDEFTSSQLHSEGVQIYNNNIGNISQAVLRELQIRLQKS